jgi:soluble lytic murein transglycosylase-like protein
MPAFAASPEHAATVVRADQHSGRLTRVTVTRTTVPIVSVPVAPLLVQSRVPDSLPLPADAPQIAQNPSDLVALIDQIASEQGVENSLVHSVIRAESNYNAHAVSPKGALGMMQLIPSTARRFGVTNAFDPKDNIRGGVRYLKFLLDYFQNDYPKAIAAYNAGEGAVDKYHGIPPYAETQNYVFRVGQNLKTARQARVQPAVAAAKEPVSIAAAETYKPIQTSVGEDGRVYYRTP